jgi:hypothetical protein
MFDYTNIDHLYVYHHNEQKLSSNEKSPEIDVSHALISFKLTLNIVFVFCFLHILSRCMKFITTLKPMMFKQFQYFVLVIDMDSFLLPKISSIPGFRHLKIFLDIFTKSFKPLHVVTAEMKRQQNREKQKRYREKMKDKIKLSKLLYREKNRDKIKLYREQYKDRNKIYQHMYYEGNRPKILEKRKSHWKATCDEKRRCIESSAKGNSNKKISDFLSTSYSNDSEETNMNIQGDGYNENMKKILSAIDRRFCHGTTLIDEKNGLPNPNLQRANVCVVCDRLIIGMEEVKRISKQQLTENADRLNVSQYEEHFSISLKQDLVVQYQVEDYDLKDLLLSPRAQRSIDKKHYQCCSSCYNCLVKGKKEEGRNPPKFSIANGFAIGHIPKLLRYKTKSGEMKEKEVDVEKDFDDIFCSAISPVRPFGYVHAYSGGKQKSIKGHFSFFSVDQSHVGGVVNKYRNIKNAAKNIFVVLCGRMTPEQKNIVQRQVCAIHDMFNVTFCLTLKFITTQKFITVVTITTSQKFIFFTTHENSSPPRITKFQSLHH